jgi:hypothetical protein
MVLNGLESVYYINRSGPVGKEGKTCLAQNLNVKHRIPFD